MNGKMRNDLPNQIHMILCALFPLSVVVLLYSVFRVPFGVAAGGGILSGFISMFAITLLTFKIYSVIAKAKYGKVPEDAVVHTTDAGCSSIIFVVLVLLLYPVFLNAKQKREANLKKQNAAHQQLRPSGAK